MAKQVEDIDANLTGDDGKTEESKASWFRRIKKGISTKTSEKRKYLKDCGLNALSVVK
jgi:acetyl-CoA carboxylase carboxyl transferase subunit beta